MLKKEFNLYAKPSNIKILLFNNERKDKSSKKNIDDLIVDFETKKFYFSKSHCDDISALAYSDKFKIGIDIEDYSRHISKSLINKILSKNIKLNLKPIELWVLMESSFKCVNTKSHFTLYEFNKNEEWYVTTNNGKKIYSKLIPYKDKCIAVSLHRENISRNDFYNRMTVAERDSSPR